MTLVGRPQVSINDLPIPAHFERFHPFLKGVFSQWHPAGFELGGATYSTAEQWMMAGKARLFGDEGALAQILGSDDPAVQKRAGQAVAGFDQSLWDMWKVDIVWRGNLAKFTQNDGAARQLISTGEAMLVEANPRDWNWGCGLSVDDPAISRPAEWPGENLLGRILTGVRQVMGA